MGGQPKWVITVVSDFFSSRSFVFDLTKKFIDIFTPKFVLVKLCNVYITKNTTSTFFRTIIRVCSDRVSIPERNSREIQVFEDIALKIGRKCRKCAILHVFAERVILKMSQILHIFEFAIAFSDRFEFRKK